MMLIETPEIKSTPLSKGTPLWSNNEKTCFLKVQLKERRAHHYRNFTKFYNSVEYELYHLSDWHTFLTDILAIIYITSGSEAILL